MRNEYKTKRLSLIPLGIKFLKSTHEYASNLENCKYMLFLPNKTIEETKQFLNQCDLNWQNKNNDCFEYAIIYEGVHIGAVSLYLENDIAEIGWIVNEKYQGQGFAYEASKALIEIGFKNLNINKIIAHCDINNIPSYKLMEKLGFNKVLIQERKYFDNRGISKEYQYELKKDC